MSAKENDKGEEEETGKVEATPEKSNQSNFWSKLKSIFCRSDGEANQDQSKGSRRSTTLSLNNVDLSEEEMEELRMVSNFTDKELKILRIRFSQVAKQSDSLLPHQLYEYPEIKNNPLRDRLAKCFDTDKNGRIEFREFVSVLSIMSQDGQREQKLKLAFTIHDYDGDGKISKQDLKCYLSDVTSIPYSEEEEELQKEFEMEESESMSESTLVEKIESYQSKIDELKKKPKKKGKKKEKKNEPDEKADSDKRENEVVKEAGKTTESPAEDNIKDKLAKSESVKELGKDLIDRYEQRIKYLQKEETLDKIVIKVFEEASSDNQHISREDFLRVIGPTDFQGKLVIGMTNMKI